MKTRFDLMISLRISKDGAGHDRYTKDEIIKLMDSGDVKITDRFLLDETKTLKVIAEIENIKIPVKEWREVPPDKGGDMSPESYGDPPDWRKWEDNFRCLREQGPLS